MPDLVDAETGQLVPVPSGAEATAGLRSGRYRWPADKPLIFADENDPSRVIQVDPTAGNNFQAFVDNPRFFIPDDDTAEAAAERVRGRSTESQLAATGAGIARGATFGLSDVAGAALGAGDELARLQDIAPGASFAGEVVGGIAGGIATGGVTGGLRGTGGLARAALAGEGRAAGSAAARLGVEGLIEGAAQGAGQVLSEDALGRAELTGERLVAGAGIGSLLGLAGGAGLGAIGEGLEGIGRTLARSGGRAPRQTVDALRDAIQRETGQELAPGVLDGVLEQLGRASTAGLDQADGAFLRQGLSRTAEGRRLREILDRGEGVIDDVLEPLTRQLDELASVSDATQDFAKGALKRNGVLQQIRADRLEDVAGEASTLFGRARLLADEVSGEMGLPGARALARDLRGISEQFEEAVSAGLARGGREGAADAFIALDQAKRRLGRLASKTARSPNTGVLHEQFAELYDAFRRGLESEDLFGGAGALQREINGVWSEAIGRGKAFSSRFLRKFGETDGFFDVREIDPAKLRAFLKETGTGKAAKVDELFEAHVRLQGDLMETIRKHYDLPPELQEQIARQASALEGLRGSLDEVRGSVRARNQFLDISQQLTERQGILGVGAGMGAGVGGALGGLVGGAPGAIAGSALGGAIAGAVTRPDRLVRMLGSIERMAGRFDADLTGGVGRYLERIGATARKSAGAAAAGAGRAARGGTRVARSAGIQIGLNEFQPTIDAITEASGGGMQRRVEEQTRSLHAIAPNVTAQAVATAARGASYLESQIPSTARPVQVGPFRPRTVTSDVEKSRFLAKVEIVRDPRAIIDRLEDGKLTKDHVEALRAVYPEIYQDLVQKVLGELAEASENDTLPPYQERVRLGMLLGIQTDPSLAPEVVATLQASYVTQPPIPAAVPERSAPDELAPMLLTDAQRLAGKRDRKQAI